MGHETDKYRYLTSYFRRGGYNTLMKLISPKLSDPAEFRLHIMVRQIDLIEPFRKNVPEEVISFTMMKMHLKSSLQSIYTGITFRGRIMP